MAKIAMDENAELSLRAQMCRELAQYVAPKRRAVRYSAGAGTTEAPDRKTGSCGSSGYREATSAGRRDDDAGFSAGHCLVARASTERRPVEIAGEALDCPQPVCSVLNATRPLKTTV